MEIALFDSLQVKKFYPLAYTKPISHFRWGILTIKEKWELLLQQPVQSLTYPYLSKKYTFSQQVDTIFVNSCFLPNKAFTEQLENLSLNKALVSNSGSLVALRTDEKIDSLAHIFKLSESLPSQVLKTSIDTLENVWDLFSQNARELSNDFNLITQGRKSQSVQPGNNIIGNNIFLEKDATISASTINTNTGPVYLAEGAEIMEGCLVRGGLALGEHAQLKMGAKIYGASTFGPYCKRGGEVNNSILFGYSNKGHDGFLGNSVLGEWCNLGADTNNSNLKNNYSEVKFWDYESERLTNTGLQFCGLIMGDHAKAGINTMFNTGTSVGVASNVFGAGFPEKFIPSFFWGGAELSETFKLEKAFEMAEKMCERRNIPFTEDDKAIFGHIFRETEKFRQF